MKKFLAVHSNKLFFGNSPNFYEWLADQRGLLKQYEPLKEGYNQGKKGPVYLSSTYCLTVVGLTPLELTKYCTKYFELFFDRMVFKQIQYLSSIVKMAIFTSYSEKLYRPLDGIVHKICGAEYILDEYEIKIANIDNIHPRKENTEKIRKKMKTFGFENNILPEPPGFGMSEQLRYEIELGSINILPDRYGLLVLLIHEMMINNLSKDDVIVLGKGITAKPMHKVAGRVIESLSEI
ncbi:hypothetical protein KAJ61_05635 [Candidatus Parcubacteria bacterium]|nr:hypothetical protein [Candidatus Parcubacteria bacterium]